MQRWAALLVAGHVLVLAAACGRDGGPAVRQVTAAPASPSPTASPTAAPPTAEPPEPTPLPTAAMPPPAGDLLEAILTYVRGKGWRYGGDCRSAALPNDAGKHCVGAIRRLPDGRFEAAFGPVASEGEVAAVFQQAEGAWTVAAEEPLPRPEPPGASDDLIPAVQGYMEGRGWHYGGDCRATDLPADAGKHCFGVVFVQPDGTVAVGIGRTFSEGGVMVRFGLSGAAWTVVGEEAIAPPGP